MKDKNHAPAAGRVLGLFAKQPQPGQVKTRLAAAVSTEWAARVAAAFLHDTVKRLAQVEARRILCFSPAEARCYFEALTAPQFALTPQSDGDVGRRMVAFFAEQLKADAKQVVLLGADSPTVPLAYIEQAFHALQNADVVLGPATDGGYYLLGCAGSVPGIFQAIPWGSSQVLDSTMEAIARGRYRFAILPPWYDVDTLDDWRMLKGHVAAMRQAGFDPEIVHTERLLQEPIP